MGDQPKADAQRIGAARWPLWAYAVVAVGLALLAVSVAAEGGAFGYGSRQVLIGDIAFLTITVSAAGFATAAAWIRRDLGGWGLIALALVVSAVADLYYQFEVDAIEGPYPSIADYLYFAFYVLAILGLRTLAVRARRESFSIPALLTPLLGLATLWSWVVFDPVIGTLEGTTAARMTTVAYPFLDLLLIFAGVIALAAMGWRAGPSLVLLIAGAAVTGVADSYLASEVAKGFFADQTVIDSLWPVSVMLMATAAWVGTMAAGADRGARRGESRLDRAFALGALAVALTVLVWDHFDQLDSVTVVLAALTLLAGAARLWRLFNEADRARQEMLAAQREHGRVQALHTAAAEAALDSIVTVDADGRVVDWNPAAQRTFGFVRQQVLGEIASELIVPPEHRNAYERAFAHFVSGAAPEIGGKRIEMMGLRSDLVEVPLEVVFTAAGEDPPRFTAFIRDISERKHGEAERDRLAAMVRSSEDAMLSTNLDLTVIAWNPAAERVYGYRAEEIVGSKLERLVPPDRRAELGELVDTISAGDSVSVETKRVRKDGEVIDVALRVYPIRGELDSVVGYSSVARDITDRRKRERAERLNHEREAWKHQIAEALDHGGFEFHRQPVVDLSSGRVAHHELLLRLRLDDELVPPARFLPHAESSSRLMRRIDRWAIRHGIALAAEQPVAINLSARSLSDAGIASAVQAGLDESGADAHDVTFEITETAAAENLEAAHTLVQALRGLGCGVALDDFGTGFGSFTYLLRMPVTSLKIDMEFIRALSDEPEDQRVVRSIVAVAQNFGLTTVAEGVEEEHALWLLRTMGVDNVQGYLIGRPSGDWATDADVAAIVASSGPR